MDFSNCLPSKKSDNNFWTFGISVEPPSKTISSTLALGILASFMTCSTGVKVDLNKAALMSSNSASVRFLEKSSPSNKESTSTLVWVMEDKVLLARSQAVLNLLKGENNANGITGFFLVRGQDYAPAFDVAPDWESYDYTKLDGSEENVRKFVDNMLAWDEPVEVDGKKIEIADGKVFK